MLSRHRFRSMFKELFWCPAFEILVAAPLIRLQSWKLLQEKKSCHSLNLACTALLSCISIGQAILIDCLDAVGAQDLSGRVMNRCSGTLLGSHGGSDTSSNLLHVDVDSSSALRWRRSDERHPVLNPGNKAEIQWFLHNANQSAVGRTSLCLGKAKQQTS